MNRFSNTLTLPLLVLLVTLLVVIALVKISNDRADDARRILDAQQMQMREAQMRVQKSGTEKDLIVRYLPDYQKLDTLGFVGSEQRINWLDALRNANQKGGMFGINYEISARKAYPYAAALGPGQLNVMQSVMKLRFQMLHEEDLLKFLEHLSEQNAGVFVVNRCDMRRTSTTQTTRFQPNMTAECELAWITAQPPALAEVRQ
ncbi:MAG TPA: hypothetical protein VK642_06860 [Burkholderiales bacterium]|nr:hypothetical protein [Burkholderiales bacterium]